MSRERPLPIEALDRLREASSLILLLDYDGTLCPLAPRPELAAPSKALLGLLSDLAARPGTSVHVVSGRKREDLDRWLGDLPIGLHGEHGYCSRAAKGEAWTTVAMVPPLWKPAVRGVLDDLTRRTPGSFVEEKPVSIAWHYRNAEPDLAAEHSRGLGSRLKSIFIAHDLEVIEGACVLEVRPIGIHKGRIVPALLEGAPEVAVVAIGDDRTDEDLFAALPPAAVTIHVGSGPSRAAFCLPDVGAVHRFLRSLMVG